MSPERDRKPDDGLQGEQLVYYERLIVEHKVDHWLAGSICHGVTIPDIIEAINRHSAYEMKIPEFIALVNRKRSLTKIRYHAYVAFKKHLTRAADEIIAVAAAETYDPEQLIELAESFNPGEIEINELIINHVVNRLDLLVGKRENEKAPRTVNWLKDTRKKFNMPKPNYKLEIKEEPDDPGYTETIPF